MLNYMLHVGDNVKIDLRDVWYDVELDELACSRRRKSTCSTSHVLLLSWFYRQFC